MSIKVITPCMIVIKKNEIKMKEICKTKNCKHEVLSKGLCKRCYYFKRKYGENYEEKLDPVKNREEKHREWIKRTIGKEYHQLTIIKVLNRFFLGKDKKTSSYTVLCKCNCGRRRIVRLNNLQMGLVKACKKCSRDGRKYNFKWKGASVEEDTKELFSVFNFIRGVCYNDLIISIMERKE